MAVDAPDDPPRLARVLASYGRAIDRLVGTYARNEADRDDLWQEVSVALFQALPRFRGDGSERAFVMRVAHNRALDFVARRGVAASDGGEAADAVAATSGKNPAVRYERREGEHRLMTAVRALPVPLKQVVTLLLEGMEHEEIAEVLGISANNVAVRSHRARVALRVLLDESNEGGVR
jgi:RNA polymerase sigma-70 factor (ECF subfamily)